MLVARRKAPSLVTRWPSVRWATSPGAGARIVRNFAIRNGTACRPGRCCRNRIGRPCTASTRKGHDGQDRRQDDATRRSLRSRLRLASCFAVPGVPTCLLVILPARGGLVHGAPTPAAYPRAARADGDHSVVPVRRSHETSRLEATRSMRPKEPAANRHAPPNVLVTAAGRRTGLVQAFVKAAHARGGRTLAGDVDGLAPALYLADEAVRTRRADDSRYIEDLLEPSVGTASGCSCRRSTRTCRPSPGMPRDSRQPAARWRSPPRVHRHDDGQAPDRAGLRGGRRPRAAIVDPAAAGLRPSSRAEVFVKPRAGSASQDTYQIDLSRARRCPPPRPRADRPGGADRAGDHDRRAARPGRPPDPLRPAPPDPDPRRRVDPGRDAGARHRVRDVDRGACSTVAAEMGARRSADAAGLRAPPRTGALGDQRPVRRRVPAGARGRRRLSGLAPGHDRRVEVRPRLGRRTKRACS